MGGAILCRACEPMVRQIMEQRRADGMPVNVRHIAREVFRRDHAGSDLLIREIPAQLLAEVQAHARESGMSQRDYIIDALRQAVAARTRPAAPYRLLCGGDAVALGIDRGDAWDMTAFARHMEKCQACRCGLAHILEEGLRRG